MKKPKVRRPEDVIEHDILVYLYGLRIGFFWKNLSTGYFDGKAFRKQASPFAINGVPDILGVVNGMLIGFEVKAPNGVERPSQIAFRKRAISEGAKVATVRSLREVIAALESWGLLPQEQPCAPSISK